jgi:UV excision repair protein RAD23
MKISIKTLQGKIVEIEVNETDTVAILKEKVQKELNVEPVNQKLITYGKILDNDNKTLADYKVKEKDFIVLMITKVFPSYYP